MGFDQGTALGLSRNKHYIKNMDLLISLLLFITPLFYLSGYTNSFDLGKNAIFRSLILLIIFAGAILWVKKGSFKLKISRFKNPLAVIFWAIFTVFLLSTIFSGASILAFFGNYQRLFGFISWIFVTICFVILLNSLNLKNLEKFGLALFLSAVLTSLYAVFQKFGIDPLFKYFNANLFEGRVYSTLGNPDFLAQFVAPVIPLAVAFIFYTKNTYLKLLNILAVIIMVAALVFSESRSSILGVIVGAAIFAVYFIVKKRFGLKQILKGLTVILAAGLTVGLLFFFKGGQSLERFKINPTNLRSVESRLNIWGSAWKNILAHPLLGTGIDTFAIYFPQYLEPHFFELEEGLNLLADREHNELLQFGVWGGLPAMILYLLMIGFGLKMFFNSPLKKHHLADAVFIGFFILIFQNFFTFSSVSHYMLLTFFLTAMVAITEKKVEEMDLKIRNENLGLLLIPFGLGLVFIWYQAVLVPTKIDALYIKALSSTNLTEMNKNLNELVKLNPYSAQFYYELIMRNYVIQPEWIEAITRIEGKTMNVLAWKGNYFSQFGLEEGVKHLKEAMALNPQYPPVIRAIADQYFKNNDCEEAVKYYEDYLKYAPHFWQWKDNLKSRSAAEQKSYRIFFQNEPDFSSVFKHVVQCYAALGNIGKIEFYTKYVNP